MRNPPSESVPSLSVMMALVAVRFVLAASCLVLLIISLLPLPKQEEREFPCFLDNPFDRINFDVLSCPAPPPRPSPPSFSEPNMTLKRVSTCISFPKQLNRGWLQRDYALESAGAQVSPGGEGRSKFLSRMLINSIEPGDCALIKTPFNFSLFLPCRLEVTHVGLDHISSSNSLFPELDNPPRSLTFNAPGKSLGNFEFTPGATSTTWKLSEPIQTRELWIGVEARRSGEIVCLYKVRVHSKTEVCRMKAF